MKQYQTAAQGGFLTRNRPGVVPMSTQKKRSFKSTGNRVETPDNVYSSLTFSSVRTESPLEMLAKKDKTDRGETQPSALSNY